MGGNCEDEGGGGDCFAGGDCVGYKGLGVEEGWLGGGGEVVDCAAEDDGGGDEEGDST